MFGRTDELACEEPLIGQALWCRMLPNAFCEVAVYDTVTVRLSPLSVTATFRLLGL